MASFLEICQKVAADSGTISGTYPTAVTDQSGRLLLVVNSVIEAWQRLQDSQSAWRWMRKEFTFASLSSGTAKYTAASLSITDFSRWIIEAESLSMYLTATGVSDEGDLNFVEWSPWRKTYSRGTQTNQRPVNVAVSPANQLCFGPVPDAAYTISGEYMQTATILAANEDVPAMPVRFHDLIAYDALLLVNEFDVALISAATAQRRRRELYTDLKRDQLPMISIGSEPLA